MKKIRTSYDVTGSDKLDQYLSTVSTSFTVNRYFSTQILLLGIISCICTPSFRFQKLRRYELLDIVDVKTIIFHIKTHITQKVRTYQ